MRHALRVFATLLLLSGPAAVSAQDAPPDSVRTPARPAWAEGVGDGPVFVVDIEGTVDNGLAVYVERALREATESGAAAVVFHMDTFGGLVTSADEIRKAILDAPMLTIAFVDRNAASAGALISYAADRILMAPGSSIGAATVVEGTTGEAAPDKYQSYMRAQMRATAEANGRDPDIAEAMVDASIEIPGISEAGKVLTLSAEEAVRHGVADAIVDDLDAVTAGLGSDPGRTTAFRSNTVEGIIRFFGSPVVQSILMLMMLGGLYFELQTPGVGFPGLMALVGAALFFGPNYLGGLVESWEIVVFVIGLVLLFVEVFVTPGFGAAGITGLVLVVFSLLMSLMGNVGFSFPSSHDVMAAVTTLATTLVLFVVLAFSLGRWLPRSERFGQLVLVPDLASAVGYTSADTHDEWVGRTGTALTPLRPSGAADIDGTRVDVVTAGDYIEAGAAIRVVGVRGARVEVRRAPGNDAHETSQA